MEFNTSLGTLRMLMNGKSCLIPLINVRKADGSDYISVS